MKTILAVMLVASLSAEICHADYLIYDVPSGRIIAKKPDSTRDPGVGAMEYNGPWENVYFRSRKISGGKLIDVPEYGRKIVIEGDTSILADGSSSANLTVRLVEMNGDLVTDADKDIRIITNRGTLSTRELTTVNGIASFTVSNVFETIDVEIKAIDKTGMFKRVEYIIQAEPGEPFAQGGMLAAASAAGAAAGAAAGLAAAKKQKEQPTA